MMKLGDNFEYSGEFKDFENTKKVDSKRTDQRLYVSDKTISKWESNRCVPDIFMIEEIANIFEVSLIFVLNGDDGKEPRNRQLMKFFYFVTIWVKKHTEFSLSILLSVLSLIVLSIFSDEISYFYLQIVMVTYIILLSLKYSEWYLIILLLVATQFTDQMIVYFQLHLLDIVLLIPLFAFIIMFLLFITKEIVISKKWIRFIILFDIIVILTFMTLIMKAFVVSYHITSSLDYSDILSTTNYWFSTFTISALLIIVGAIHQWIVPRLSSKISEASLS